MNGLLLNVICAFTIANTNPNIEKAQQTLDALYQNYAAPNTCLLRENYPFDQDSKATYLASEEQAKRRNEYSYLWPYSGTFSAVNALLESTENKKYNSFSAESQSKFVEYAAFFVHMFFKKTSSFFHEISISFSYSSSILRNVLRRNKREPNELQTSSFFTSFISLKRSAPGR